MGAVGRDARRGVELRSPKVEEDVASIRGIAGHPSEADRDMASRLIALSDVERQVVLDVLNPERPMNSERLGYPRSIEAVGAAPEEQGSQ